VWQREVVIVSQIGASYGEIAPRVRVKIKVEPQNGAASDASWLDVSGGTTDVQGTLRARQFWKWVPGASLQLENYPVKAALVK
jgi:hypothetical protein